VAAANAALGLQQLEGGGVEEVVEEDRRPERRDLGAVE
jgi:hypothetical protein